METTNKNAAWRGGIADNEHRHPEKSVKINILPVRKVFKSPARQALFDFGQLLYCRYVDGGVNAEETARLALEDVPGMIKAILDRAPTRGVV